MNLLYSIFISVVWFLSTYFAVVLLLILITRKSRLFDSPSPKSFKELPMVSILVPVYNEGTNVKLTINSLKKVDYPKDKLEIIILNDGSSDNTAEMVRKHINRSTMVFVDNKKNKGKAATLNQGIMLAKGEFVGTMDGDSEVSPDIVKKTIPYFRNEKIGAVTVTVEVKNPKSFLQKIVEIEYVIGLSLALKALSFFNAVHVTPGPFSIYRKSVLKEIGMFDEKNITEDLEIAYRIHKHGYRITNCTTTKVKTITPQDFKTLYVQRKRWYTGSLLTLWKHKNLVFKKKYGAFAFIMPYTFILVTLGLLLVIFSLFLSLKNLFKALSFHALTNFNFFSYWTWENLKNVDLLKTSTLSIFGVLGIVTTVVSAYLCLRIANKRIKTRMPGFVGFIFLFFLYQLYWASSFYSAILGRKVKWR